MDIPGTILRIIDGESPEKTFGTGFVVDLERRLAVTCAHVIEMAGSGPGRQVQLAFHPYIENEIFSATVLEQCWRSQEAEDVAFLELEPKVLFPAGASRFVLGVLPINSNGDLQSFGFPESKPVEGLPAECHLVGDTTENRFPVLVTRSQEMTLGFSGAPVWDPNLRVAVGMAVSIIGGAADAEERNKNTAFVVPSKTLLDICRVLRLDNECPYRGLEYFTESSEPDYEGRDRLISHCMSVLSRKRFLSIVGESGSGKSSFVRAGLKRGLNRFPAPRLRDSKRCLFTPSNTPLVSLLLALSTIDGESSSHVEEVFELPAGSLAVPDTELLENLSSRSVQYLVDRLHSFGGQAGLLLVVDQFERLFTECHEERRRRLFSQILTKAAHESVTIVIAVRLDFNTQCGDYLGAPFYAGRSLLWQMKEEELTAVIYEPARRRGREVEAALLTQLIADMEDAPGNLPLLQFALREIWEKDGEQGMLTLKTYRALGKQSPNDPSSQGIRGIICRRAEQEWARFPTQRERNLARRVFLSIVNVAPLGADELPVAPDTSRRAEQHEWDDATQVVGRKLADSFLLTTGVNPFTNEATFEVAHESLIREWPRLRNWIADLRPFLSWFSRELTPWRQRWAENNSSRDYLLPESELLEAREWMQKNPEFFTGSVKEFIVQSEKHLAAEKQQASLRRWIATAFTIATGVGFVVTLHFCQETKIVKEDLTRELAKTYFAKGEGLLSQEDICGAELYFAKSLTFDANNQAARECLIESRAKGVGLLRTVTAELKFLSLSVSVNGTPLAAGVQNDAVVLVNLLSGKSQRLEADIASEIFCTAFSSGGTALAVGAKDGRVHMWDLSDPAAAARVIPPPTADAGGVISVAFDHSAKKIACSYGNQTVVIWNLAPSAKLEKTFKGFDDIVLSSSFSPDNRWLATGSRDRSVKVWDLSGKRPEQFELGKHEDVVTSVSFSPDGKVLASAGKDLKIRVWRYADPSEGQRTESEINWDHPVDGFTWRETTLSGFQSSANAVAFDSTGQYLTASITDRTVRQWDVRTGRLTLTLEGRGGAMRAVACGKDSNASDIIVAGGDDNKVRVWRTDEPRDELQVLRGAHQGPVAALAFSKRGVFASGGQDEIIRLWRLENNKFVGTPLPNSVGKVLWLDFSQDGRFLAAAHENQIVSVWDLDQSPPENIAKLNRQGSVWGVAFGKGYRLAAGDSTGSIIFWNAETRDFDRAGLQADNVKVLCVAFSPDGQYFAAGSRDGGLHLWNLANSEGTELRGHKGAVWGVAFSPSGKYLVSGSEDEKVIVWNVQSKSVERELVGHEGEVWTVCFPSEDQVLSGGNDGMIRLWNWRDSSCRLTLRDRDYTVWCAAMVSGGRFIGAAELDWNVRLWNIDALEKIMTADPHELLKQAEKDTGMKLNGFEVIENDVVLN